MRPEERASLKSRYAIEIEDFNLRISRAQQRLDQRVQRQELDRVNLEMLKTDLERAQNLLTYLNDMGAEQVMIDSQQVVVNKLQEEVSSQNKGIQALTNTEIALEVTEIEDLVNMVQHRQDKIGQINALSAAA
jgi:hypothetical protein